MEQKTREGVGIQQNAATENGKDYLRPAAASMEEFTLKTAVGVSPAMKKDETYIVSTLF